MKHESGAILGRTLGSFLFCQRRNLYTVTRGPGTRCCEPLLISFQFSSRLAPACSQIVDYRQQFPQVQSPSLASCTLVLKYDQNAIRLEANEKRVVIALIACMQHMNRFECVNSLWLSADLITVYVLPSPAVRWPRGLAGWISNYGLKNEKLKK